MSFNPDVWNVEVYLHLFILPIDFQTDHELLINYINSMYLDFYNWIMTETNGHTTYWIIYDLDIATLR